MPVISQKKNFPLKHGLFSDEFELILHPRGGNLTTQLILMYVYYTRIQLFWNIALDSSKMSQ